MFIFPPVDYIENHKASSNNANIGLDKGKIVKIDAKAGIKKLKKSKIVKHKKVKAVKKVKKAKKYKVKVRYFYKGKWRYKWVYKYYTPVTVQAAAPAPAPAPTRYVGAYDVVVTPQYVMATGRCSCSLYTDYNYHTRVFFNYNPAKNTWGTLNFEQGPAPLTSPEGMWYDTVTDMDFCLVHGKSHDNRNVYLVPYNGVINGINVVNGYFTDKAVVPTTDNSNGSENSNNSNNSQNSDNKNNTDGSNSSNSTNDTKA